MPQLDVYNYKSGLVVMAVLFMVVIGLVVFYLVPVLALNAKTRAKVDLLFSVTKKYIEGKV